jgi:NTP pyrophosphatase (non-canonical NTP hydrolase)
VRQLFILMTKSKLFLKAKPTLRDFQNYVAKMIGERGFDKETLPEVFMLFMEECGEMAKAVRRTQDIKFCSDSKDYKLEYEIADVFIYLIDICNYLDVDLEKAFREKEEINKKRIWK